MISANVHPVEKRAAEDLRGCWEHLLRAEGVLVRPGWPKAWSLPEDVEPGGLLDHLAHVLRRGRPPLLLAQPYRLAAVELRALVELEARGWDAEVHARGSLHLPGLSLLVQLTPPRVRP